jgi:hypothetical protein
MAVLQHYFVFQDGGGGGGGGHLRKWRYTSGFSFFGFSMFFLVCVSSFIKIGS